MTANARSATVEAGAAPGAIEPAAAPRRDGDKRPSRLGEALRAARWTLRRWSLKHIWYRARLPIRRRRWAAANLERTQAFAKDPAARPTAGPAIAFGAFSGAFGLARAAAYDLPALRARHAAVTAIDIDPYLKGAPRRPLDLAGPFDNVYFLCQPDTYGMICELLRPSDIAAAYRVGRWVWETPRFPEAWRFAARLIHEVWTPSEYCAATFRAALDLPVRVVPYAVTAPPDPGLDMRARLGVPREAFMGLAVMDILPCPERKNPWAHVRAWQAAFADDANAVLVMKVRVGKRTRLVLDELRELIGGAANIRLLVDEMSDDEIAALHHAADLYLSLHRAEGFGLNIYEALLLGKPVVATHWSANAEYGPRFENYVGVPARMTRYRDWMGQYADGAFEWGDVDPQSVGLALDRASARVLNQAPPLNVSLLRYEPMAESQTSPNVLDDFAPSPNASSAYTRALKTELEKARSELEDLGVELAAVKARKEADLDKPRAERALARERLADDDGPRTRTEDELAETRAQLTFVKERLAVADDRCSSALAALAKMENAFARARSRPFHNYRMYVRWKAALFWLRLSPLLSASRVSRLKHRVRKYAPPIAFVKAKSLRNYHHRPNALATKGAVADVEPLSKRRWRPSRVALAVAFHSNGKPRRLLRRLLFHSDGRVRGVFRGFVFRRDGVLRSLFERRGSSPAPERSIERGVSAGMAESDRLRDSGEAIREIYVRLLAARSYFSRDL